MSREFPKNNPPQNSAPKIALPTIGRIVHVFGLISDGAGPDVPRAGIVCGAEPGQLTINASVWARSGDTFVGGVQNLLHASMPRHPGDLYWDWMDFQKGQAAKTEQLEERIDQMKAARDTSAGNEMGKLQAGAPSPVDGKR